MTSDRLRLVSVPKSVLIALNSGNMKKWENYSKLVQTEFLKDTVENLPEGFQVQHCQFNMQRAALEFIVSHDSFSPVPDGSFLTDFPAKFRPIPH
jgi:hypothetical protein